MQSHIEQKSASAEQKSLLSYQTIKDHIRQSAYYKQLCFAKNHPDNRQKLIHELESFVKRLDQIEKIKNDDHYQTYRPIWCKFDAELRDVARYFITLLKDSDVTLNHIDKIVRTFLTTYSYENIIIPQLKELKITLGSIISYKKLFSKLNSLFTQALENELKQNAAGLKPSSEDALLTEQLVLQHILVQSGVVNCLVQPLIDYCQKHEPKAAHYFDAHRLYEKYVHLYTKDPTPINKQKKDAALECQRAAMIALNDHPLKNVIVSRDSMEDYMNYLESHFEELPSELKNALLSQNVIAKIEVFLQKNPVTTSPPALHHNTVILSTSDIERDIEYTIHKKGSNVQYYAQVFLNIISTIPQDALHIKYYWLLRISCILISSSDRAFQPDNDPFVKLSSSPKAYSAFARCMLDFITTDKYITSRWSDTQKKLTSAYQNTEVKSEPIPPLSATQRELLKIIQEKNQQFHHQLHQYIDHDNRWYMPDHSSYQALYAKMGANYYLKDCILSGKTLTSEIMHEIRTLFGSDAFYPSDYIIKQDIVKEDKVQAQPKKKGFQCSASQPLLTTISSSGSNIGLFQAAPTPTPLPDAPKKSGWSLSLVG